MADNILIDQGISTPIATTSISGVHHQKFKMEYGDDGVATQVSATNPLPTKNSGGFNLGSFDYVGVTYNSTSDVYVYKLGGSAGTTTGTITITYTSTVKDTIQSVVRT